MERAECSVSSDHIPRYFVSRLHHRPIGPMLARARIFVHQATKSYFDATGEMSRKAEVPEYPTMKPISSPPQKSSTVKMDCTSDFRTLNITAAPLSIAARQVVPASFHPVCAEAALPFMISLRDRARLPSISPTTPPNRTAPIAAFTGTVKLTVFENFLPGPWVASPFGVLSGWRVEFVYHRQLKPILGRHEERVLAAAEANVPDVGTAWL